MKLKTLLILNILGIALLSSAFIIFLGDLSSSSSSRYEKPPEKLEFTLYQLTKVKDVYAHAKSHGLYVDDAKRVRVVIELTGESLPKGYGIIVEARHANLVQTLVPINQLVDLTKDPMVKYVRAPIKPFPVGGIPS